MDAAPVTVNNMGPLMSGGPNWAGIDISGGSIAPGSIDLSSLTPFTGSKFTGPNNTYAGINPATGQQESLIQNPSQGDQYFFQSQIPQAYQSMFPVAQIPKVSSEDWITKLFNAAPEALALGLPTAGLGGLLSGGADWGATAAGSGVGDLTGFGSAGGTAAGSSPLLESLIGNPAAAGPGGMVSDFAGLDSAGSGVPENGGFSPADTAQFGTPDAPVSVGGPGQTSLLDMISSVFGGSGASTGLLSRVAAAAGLPAGISNNIGSAFNIGSGIYGLMQGNDLKKRAQLLAQQADPFGQYRSGYAQQLQSLMANPSSITQIPGYQAGLQAVERRGAAQGWNGSGNMMDALANYGGNFYNQQIQNLMGLSGSNFNPASAASIGLQGSQAGASIGMQGLNRVGYGVTQQDPSSNALLQLLLNRTLH